MTIPLYDLGRYGVIVSALLSATETPLLSVSNISNELQPDIAMLLDAGNVAIAVYDGTALLYSSKAYLALFGFAEADDLRAAMADGRFQLPDPANKHQAEHFELRVSLVIVLFSRPFKTERGSNNRTDLGDECSQAEAFTHY